MFPAEIGRTTQDCKQIFLESAEYRHQARLWRRHVRDQDRSAFRFRHDQAALVRRQRAVRGHPPRRRLDPDTMAARADRRPKRNRGRGWRYTAGRRCPSRARPGPRRRPARGRNTAPSRPLRRAAAETATPRRTASSPHKMRLPRVQHQPIRAWPRADQPVQPSVLVQPPDTPGRILQSGLALVGEQDRIRRRAASGHSGP